MVYLIHFDQNLEHANHYLGYTSKDLPERIQSHRSGSGAAILAEANRRGIEWHVVWIWPDGDQEFERRLKDLHDSPSLCPICNPRPIRYGRHTKKKDWRSLGHAYTGPAI